MQRRTCDLLNFDVRGWQENDDDMFIMAQGDTVPTNGTSGYAIGCIFIHRDGSGSNSVLYTNIGSETSCNFDALLDSASASGTLDASFDLGKVINGATSAGNAMRVGDATDYLGIYASGGDVTMVTGGTADLTIAPDGGELTITGNVDISGTLAVLGGLTFDAITGEAGKAFVIGAPAGQNLTLDGGTTGKVIIGKTSTGDIELGDSGNTNVDITSSALINLVSALVDVTGDLDVSGDIDGTFIGT